MLIKQESESVKTCIICNVSKTLSHFSFRSDTKKHRKECKSCRNQKQQKYSKTEEGRLVQYNADQLRNKKFPERRAARSKLYRALELKQIVPLPCFICGEEAEAHHPDYSRPLDVVWLCASHHKETHLLTRGC